MDYIGEKRALLQQLILTGAPKEDFHSVAKDANVVVPRELLDKWASNFYKVPSMEYPQDPRLVNRFCVGADPEFVFTHRQRNVNGDMRDAYVHAEKLGLGTLEAFGSDMSGRQAELRAYPSRYVIDVVASLVDTLRWMNEAYNTDTYKWLAPADFAGGNGEDGIGGHVHIGRKRPQSAEVVSSLDGLTRVLLSSRVLDYDGQQRRVLATRYGRFGDMRPQGHGFEYRTMPSWLCSPWTAYLTLVLSKLAVLENFQSIQTPKGKPERIVYNLLRAYQNCDDDARIALIALAKHGMPVHSNSDFKGEWGIAPCSKKLSLMETFFPPVIEPSKDSKRELFDYLIQRTALPKRLPVITWEPFELPGALRKVTIQIHQYGVSEVASGLLSKDAQVYMTRNNNDILAISDGTKQLDGPAISKAMREYPALRGIPVTVIPRNAGITINLPYNVYSDGAHAANRGMVAALRSLLTGGLFPLAKYTDFHKLVDYVPPKKKDVRMLGRVERRIEGGL